MRDTVWSGYAQVVVDDDDLPNGMKMILEECSINTSTMKTDNVRTVLSFHKDFQNEKMLVEQVYVYYRQESPVFVPT